MNDDIGTPLLWSPLLPLEYATLSMDGYLIDFI